MDTKIQKYAKRCEIFARLLMALAIGNWVVKWFLDWYFFYAMVWFENLDITKYKTLAEVLEKFPSNQLGWLEAADRYMRIDLGESWIGLANLAKLSWASHLLGFLFDGIAVGIMALGFWYFIKLMKQLIKGSLFSADVIELLNKIAKIIFLLAVYTPINRTIVSLLITFANPPGQRFLVVTLSSNDILTLAASWFFVILTSLMRESRELQAEHDLTV